MTTAAKSDCCRTDTDALNEALRSGLETESITLTRGGIDAEVLVVPAGKSLLSIKNYIDEYREKPERRTGTAKTFTLESFIDLVTRFATASSAVFANPDQSQADVNKKLPSLTAVFDYHPETEEGGARPTDWLKHRATYHPQLTDEWKAWMAKNGQLMAMVDFAHFLEERSLDLAVAYLDDPSEQIAKGNERLKHLASLLQGSFADPVELIQLSRNFEVNAATKVKSTNRLQSGEIQMLYDEQHNDGNGQPVKVPSLFVICIPVFFAGALYRIAAKLRYRLVGGNVMWGYELVQPELAFNSAFEEMVQKVDDATQAKVYVGAPEQ